MERKPVSVEQMMEGLRLSNIRSGGGSGGFTSSLSGTHPSLMGRPNDPLREQMKKVEELSRESRTYQPRHIPSYEVMVELQLHDDYQEGGGYRIKNSVGIEFIVYPPPNLKPGDFFIYQLPQGRGIPIVKEHPDYPSGTPKKQIPLLVEPKPLETGVQKELLDRREAARGGGKKIDFTGEVGPTEDFSEELRRQEMGSGRQQVPAPGIDTPLRNSGR